MIGKENILFLLLVFNLFIRCESTQEKLVGHDNQVKSDEATLKDALKESDGRQIIPQKYKTIFIHNFINASSALTSTTLFQDRLHQFFLLDPRLAIVTKKEKGDIFLLGRIDKYQEIPIIIDSMGRTQKYKIFCEVSILVRVNPIIENDILLETRKVRFDIYYEPRALPYEDKYTAQERLFNGLSRRILLTTFNGWYTQDKTLSELNYNPNGDDDSTEERNDLSYEERKALEEANKKKSQVDPR